MTNTKPHRGISIFAWFMIVGGVLAILLAIGVFPVSSASSYSSMLETKFVASQHAARSGPDVAAQRGFVNLQPQADEWPLQMARDFLPGGHEQYTLTIDSWHHTGTVGFTVSAGSPEHARALSAWLVDTFAASLQQSYTARGITPPYSPRVWERSVEQTVPGRSILIACRLLPPLLLIAGGMILFRMRRWQRHQAKECVEAVF